MCSSISLGLQEPAQFSQKHDRPFSAVVLLFVTSLPLKKVRGRIGADCVLGLRRPLVFVTPPLTCFATLVPPTSDGLCLQVTRQTILDPMSQRPKLNTNALKTVLACQAHHWMVDKTVGAALHLLDAAELSLACSMI